jgi:hypothetical protein
MVKKTMLEDFAYKIKRLKKSNVLEKPALAIIIHLSFSIAVYYLFFITGYFAAFPRESTILRFDARWYNEIVEDGYIYEPGVGNTLAFFPLFPIVWKFSNLSALSIAIANVLLFGFGFSFMLKGRNLGLAILLLILTFPSFIFFALPYSESVFFIFCAMTLVGYRKKNDRLILIGLFGASMTRSVSILFVPAIIVCEWLDEDTTIKQKLINGTSYLLSTVCGFLLASSLMAVQNGKWFYFFEIQKYWNRHWTIPRFPFTTFDADRVIGLDAIAFVIGLISLWLLLFIVFRRTLSNKINCQNHPASKKPFVFSACFLAGITVIDTFFSHYLNGTTNLWSLNRHVMPTAFAIEFLVFFYNDFRPTRTELIALLLSILFGLIATGVFYTYKFPALFFFVFFFSTILFFKYKPEWRYYYIACYLISGFLQLSFYKDFLNGLWIG